MSAPSPARPRSVLVPAIILALGVIWTSAYVCYSFEVTRGENYRFFPPFLAWENRNWNDHLGAEYFSIAWSLYEGHGFANPFRQETGPTAWMPPVLPGIMAAVLWANDGDRVAVMNTLICVGAAALIVAGVFVLLVAGPGINRWVAVAVYWAALATQFTLAFQQTHDSGLVLLALTLVLAIACLGRPLRSGWSAAAWGLYGGLVTLIGPVIGFVWAVLTIVEAIRQRSPFQLVVAVAVSMLVVAPWTLRNYETFGRLIPVKSNLGFELYQSQCLEPDGVLHLERFISHHPYNPATADAAEYKQLGEMNFLDKKTEAFRASVRKDPWGFVDKVCNRFLAATLVYRPLDEAKEDKLYWGLWISRLTHALPFLSAVLLLATTQWFGLRREQGVVLLGYAAYLLPYVVVGYYDRYAFPLLGVKTLLVLWAAERLAQMFSRWWPESADPTAAVAPSQSGPMLHRWIAGLVISGAVWWWYGGELIDRACGVKFTQFDTNIVLPDFYQEWYSAHLWWEGQPPYEKQKNWHHHLNLSPKVTGWFFEWNAHPPGAVLLALPLGRLGFADALAVWSLVSIWCLVLSVILVTAGLRCRVPGWAVVPTLTALVFTNPFWTQMQHGQLNLILLLLLVGVWASDRTDRPGLAGLLIGAATVIKIFPAYLLIYFAVIGRWRVVAAGVLGIVAGVGLTSAVLGWSIWPDYVNMVMPHTKEFATVWTNMSLTGWWLKLFDPALSWHVAKPWPIVSSRAIAFTGAAATAIVLTALLWRFRASSATADRDRGFATALVVMLLVSPITWDHYFLLLLLPIALLWRDLPPGRPRAVFWVILAAMAASPYVLTEIGMLLVGELMDSPAGWDSPPWLTATVLSVHTYALVGLLALLLFGTKSLAGRRNGP